MNEIPATTLLIGKSVTFLSDLEQGGENGEGPSDRDLAG
jgi:hypothetical protein